MGRRTGLLELFDRQIVDANDLYALANQKVRPLFGQVAWTLDEIRDCSRAPSSAS